MMAETFYCCIYDLFHEYNLYTPWDHCNNLFTNNLIRYKAKTKKFKKKKYSMYIYELINKLVVDGIEVFCIKKKRKKKRSAVWNMHFV